MSIEWNYKGQGKHLKVCGACCLTCNGAPMDYGADGGLCHLHGSVDIIAYPSYMPEHVMRKGVRTLGFVVEE